MLNNKIRFLIIVSVVVMAVFAFSYIQAYNTELSNKFIGETKNYSVLSADETISADAKIVMEIYDINTQDIFETEYDKSSDCYGKTREEMNAYVENLNSGISTDEIKSGLLEYQLIYYSPSYVTIRKKYDTAGVAEHYQLIVENGYIVVYKYPENTFYHNTGILSMSLDEESRELIENNDTILEIDELFDFLESHST